MGHDRSQNQSVQDGKNFLTLAVKGRVYILNALPQVVKVLNRTRLCFCVIKCKYFIFYSDESFMHIERTDKNYILV